MATYNPDEPLGPDSFGGDEYASDEPTPEQDAAAERMLARIELSHAQAQEREALDKLTEAARAILAAFPCVESVTIACDLCEVDEDRGSRMYTAEKVNVAIAPGAVLDSSEIESLASDAESLRDASRGLASRAGLNDRALTVTRDDAVVA
jgi:hypothetical protein